MRRTSCDNKGSAGALVLTFISDQMQAPWCRLPGANKQACAKEGKHSDS
jgi:hypothetical protein